MRPGLANALAEIARAAPADAGDWWIVGSAAMALSGVEGVEPEDVDMLGSKATMMRFLHRWRIAPGVPRPGSRFRSYPYERISRAGCLPIETMGDLHVDADGAWVPVRPRTRVPVEIGGHRVYVPSLDEQAEILRLFGRPKDLAKAKLIAGLAGGRPPGRLP